MQLPQVSHVRPIVALCLAVSAHGWGCSDRCGECCPGENKCEAGRPYHCITTGAEPAGHWWAGPPRCPPAYPCGGGFCSYGGQPYPACAQVEGTRPVCEGNTLLYCNGALRTSHYLCKTCTVIQDSSSIRAQCDGKLGDTCQADADCAQGTVCVSRAAGESKKCSRLCDCATPGSSGYPPCCSDLASWSACGASGYCTDGDGP